MKIKKIGILAMSLIVVFTTLGVGYAMWSDTVYLNATVLTGNVELGILNQGTNDDGVADNIVWCSPAGGAAWVEVTAVFGTGSADPQCGIGDNTELKGFASLVSTNGTPNADCAGYYESVTETFTNVYPWYMATTALSIKNCGTIPLIICDIEANFTGGSIDLVPWIDFSLCIEGFYIGSFNNLDDLAAYLVEWFQTYEEDLQIEPGEAVDFQLDFCFEETADQAYPGVAMGDIMPEGATASYAITIMGCQWNEA